MLLLSYTSELTVEMKKGKRREDEEKEEGRRGEQSRRGESVRVYGDTQDTREKSDERGLLEK